MYLSIISSIIGGFIAGFRKVTNKKILPKHNTILWLVLVISLSFPISSFCKINIYKFTNITKLLNVFERYTGIHCYETIYKEINYINIKNEIKENIFPGILKKYDILVLIWSILSIYSILKVICVYFYTQFRTGNEKITDNRIVKIFEECKEDLKIKRKIKLVNQDYFTSPAIIGIFNVKVLLTDKLMDLDNQSLKCIFMHELSHYKRKDNILNVVIELLKAIHFFNPVVYKSLDKMKKDMEIATDEMAIEKLNFKEKVNYCEMMVYILQISNRKLELALGMADNTKILEERINMISEEEKLKKHYKLFSVVIALILLFLWMMFYPSSYGTNNIPELSIRLNDSEIIELKPSFENDENIQKIELKDCSDITIIIKDGNYKKYIHYDNETLKNIENNTELTNGYIEKIDDNCYKFIFNYENNKNVKYFVRFII